MLIRKSRDEKMKMKFTNIRPVQTQSCCFVKEQLKSNYYTHTKHIKKRITQISVLSSMIQWLSTLKSSGALYEMVHLWAAQSWKGTHKQKRIDWMFCFSSYVSIHIFLYAFCNIAKRKILDGNAKMHIKKRMQLN